MTRKPKKPAGSKRKATISLSAEADFRLGILAAHRSRERGRKVSRSELVEELLAPHLRGVVVSVRSVADEAVGSAA